MQVNVFSDFLDALAKVADLAKVPQNYRQDVSQTLADTYLVLNSALNMLVLRLSDVLREENDADFIRAAGELDGFQEWLAVERSFRICGTLTRTYSEAHTLLGKVKGTLFGRNWQAMVDHMDTVFTAERELAIFIGAQLQGLAAEARTTAPDPASAAGLRDKVLALRGALLRERRALIELEEKTAPFA